MALQEMDISWQVLRRIVQEWAGTATELSEVKSLVGGCINTTLALFAKDGSRAVLKISPHRVNRDYMRESMQLQLLRDVGLPVPKVYAWKIASLDDPHSYLLMEYVDGIDLGTAKKQCTPEQCDDLQRHLAELVLHMHDRTAEQYFRVAEENGPRFDSWPKFYRYVYDPILDEVTKTAPLPVKIKKQLGKIHDRLDRLIAHDDRPRLAHWDIWATNVLAGPDESGKWRITALLDPMCRYAHAEAELAYMEMFHTITPAFMKEYQKTRRLGPGYHQLRKWIYEVYPLLNHVRLFGHNYVKPLIAAIEKAATLI